MDYTDLSYCNHVKTWVEKKKQRGERYTYNMMAEAINVQRPYLSKVLSGNANLNSDQFYLLLKEMDLPESDERFLKLTWQYAQTSLHERKEDLLKEIKELVFHEQRTESQIPVEVDNEINNDLYYLNPLNQIIHICLGVEKYRKDLKLLSQRLNLSLETLQKSLQQLESMKIISWDEDIVLHSKKMHLPEDSPLFWPWKTQLNMLGLHKSKEVKCINAKDAYNFSVIFSCDEKAKEGIQKEYFRFLKKVEGIVSKAPAKEIYQMNYDLIKWA